MCASSPNVDDLGVLPNANVFFCPSVEQCCKAISEISKHNHELSEKYRKEMALRKKYHNELVDLKGNCDKW